MRSSDKTIQGKKPAPLMLAAMGVVYGDIGTSPLYAFQQCLNSTHGIAFSEDHVLGILSLLFWVLTLIVSIKYVVFVLHADNDGEGGILALTAMVLRGVDPGSRLRWFLISCGIVGAAMLYGDAIITPAISVLSAVEGVKVAMPAFGHYVLPITIGVLAVLFVIQHHGTASIGRLFGPVMLIWFVTLGALGVVHIVQRPDVLRALNPSYGIQLFFDDPFAGFLLLGSVFLAVTGAESLYADMGHFGRQPIRIDWLWFVMPALVLNYFGQGALVLAHPDAISNPFYMMVSGWGTLPLIVLATLAAVIASQAVITGAFSLTSQAIKLGYAPRLAIDYTSVEHMGQIYMPFVNWLLFAVAVLLVVGFGSSGAMASAYGLAVSGTMVITSLMLFVLARRIWHWNRLLIIAVIGPFLIIDIAFFISNATKIFDGGWVPLATGVIIYTIFMTWKRGRLLLVERMAQNGIPLEPFLQSLAISPPPRVPGTAIFMTGSIENVPQALLHNLKHNKVLHENVVFLKVSVRDVPFVAEEERLHYQNLGDGFHLVEAHYGFKEEADVLALLDSCSIQYGLGFDMMETSFFLSRETIIPSSLSGMALWRDHLFAWMSRNTTRATDYFHLPANRVIELGTHVEI